MDNPLNYLAELRDPPEYLHIEYPPVAERFLLGEWLVILKINKTGDTISSWTTTPRRHFYVSRYKADIESVKDYQAPQPDETAAVKAATKLPSKCN